jgi:allantoinase
VFGVATALQRCPDVAQAFKALGHEVACHGLKWIHYQNLPEDVEREHMREAIAIHTQLMGERPTGWYTGRDSPNTLRLVADQGFEYASDYYGDDLPFWMKLRKTDGTAAKQLIIPYTLDCNDMRFSLPQGYSHAEPFFAYMRDTFDALYAEGDPSGLNQPKMMSIGMHCRLLGRPGRIAALQKFLDHIAKFDKVWVARRTDIAQHWVKLHPAP